MEKLYQYFLKSSGVCTDTRSIVKNCFFVALKGANFNGNTFVKQAIENGALCAVVDEVEFVDETKNVFFVENSLIFLQNFALHHRKQFDIPVIGITGSNGKTTTKELLATVLSKKYNVLFTKGNFNNHIGVPLTLLQMNKNHEIAIIEMGANHFGDIQELCDIALPTHGIITNIGKAHLEGFKNFEGVLNTKKELYQSVDKRRGVIVYNQDDQILKNNLPQNTQFASYGTSQESKIKGKLEKLTPFVVLSWSCGEYQSTIVQTNLVGSYNFYNFLAAITFGILFDVEFDAINEAIVNYEPTNKRSQVIKTDNNTLILDCYNANPTSMKYALESFAAINHTSKMVIIGDMLELGDESYVEHQSIIILLNQLNLKVITVGKEFLQFNSDLMEVQCANTQELISYLQSHKPNNSLILLKGSRGIGLEVLEEYL